MSIPEAEAWAEQLEMLADEDKRSHQDALSRLQENYGEQSPISTGRDPRELIREFK